MKKVIIALLVIASLFAFVSCKDEVTYDSWAKMEVLDTTTEKGAVVNTAMNYYWSNCSPAALVSKTNIYTFNDEDAKQSGTITVTKAINDTDKDSFKFQGSFKYSNTDTFKTCEFKYDSSNNKFYDAKGTTELTDGAVYDHAYAICNLYYELLWNSSDCTRTTTEEVTEEYLLDELSEVEVDIDGDSTTDYEISCIKATVTGKGYNQKMLSPLSSTENNAIDIKFEISYKEVGATKVRTLKAIYSSVESAVGYVDTVSFDGKTYGCGY